ncbi:MAG TPA: FHA domain-containing protein, partial [Deltaproteobacteria bacterium]|nr:FHA domain-containing protein [Deltaproteobacteria bacterium]
MAARTESPGEQRVLQVLAADGTVEREVAWTEGEFEIGRLGSDLACPEDSGLAEHQIHLTWKEGRATIRDSGGGSGVWLRVDGQEGRLLRSGDQVWVGMQILVLKKQEAGWRVQHHGPDGRLRGTHPVPPRGLFIGRTSDLVLDAGDPHLSRRHAQLVPEGDAIRLYDRSAHNGTFLKLSEPTPLPDAGEFRAGRQRFRFCCERMDSPEGDLRAGVADAGKGTGTGISEPDSSTGTLKRRDSGEEGGREVLQDEGARR